MNNPETSHWQQRAQKKQDEDEKNTKTTQQRKLKRKATQTLPTSGGEPRCSRKENSWDRHSYKTSTTLHRTEQNRTSFLLV